MKVILGAFVAIFATIFVSAEIPTKCPEVNGEDVVLLPNPDDCSTFYECNEGVPFLMECSPGLEYNPELRVCDYPNPNATCIHRPESSTKNPDSQHRPSSSSPRPSSSSKPPRPSSTPKPPRPSSSPKPPRPCRPSKPRPCRPSRPSKPCRPSRPSKPCSPSPSVPPFYPSSYFSPNWWPLPREYYENILNEEYENEEYENEEYDYDSDEE